MNEVQILLNFRQALLAAMEAAEAVGVGWRRSEAYDDWDDVATSLYRALVGQPLRESVDPSLREAFELPEYDLLYNNYGRFWWLEVRDPESEGNGHRVFHSFATDEGQLDSVEVRRISNDGRPLASDELEVVPLDQVEFRLRKPLGTD